MPGGLRIVAIAMLVATAGCAAVSEPSAGMPREISYETEPCFGACPVYRVTVGADGSGLFEGRRFTGVTGERSFHVTPEQYRAFAAVLAPLRPRSGDVRYDGPPRCTRMATDLPAVTVTWRGRGGSKQSLYYYFGCDMERTRAMADRLRDAPKHLPIDAMVQPAARPAG